jgi:hypothetical protein
VLAGEIADEIGRREDGSAVDQLHRCSRDPRMPSSLAAAVTAWQSRSATASPRASGEARSPAGGG